MFTKTAPETIHPVTTLAPRRPRLSRLAVKAFAVPFVIAVTLVMVDNAFQTEPDACQRGEIRVPTAREHIPGVGKVRGAFERKAPPLHLVAAQVAPQFSLADLAKVNGLPDALAPIWSTRSGSYCLATPESAGLREAGKLPRPIEVPLPDVEQTAAETPERMTPAQIAAVARAAGFKDEGLVTAVAVSLAESAGKVQARCYNTGSGCGKRTAATRSTDRGLWQINDRAWPDVSTACADSPACAAKAAFRISRGGTNWRPWSSYKSGSWAKYLTKALKATT